MPPQKRRRDNLGLPKRWRHRYGTFYYRVPKGMEAYWDGKREFVLGHTLTEAYTTWAKRLQSINPTVRKISELLDRYASEVVPENKPATRRNKVAHLAKLRAVFGHFGLLEIKPRHVYGYIDQRRQMGGKVAGQREIETLSHAYTKAVEWGLIDKHPFLGQVRIQGNGPRDRYVEDWEIAEVMRLPSRRKKGSAGMLQAYIAVKILTGLRRTDLLNLRIADCKDDGIHVRTSKTGKALVIERSDALDAAIARAKEARPVDLGPYLFCKRDGSRYIDDEGRADSWDSMWQRFMQRVLAETSITERFTEHDLRAKAGSDSESLELAQALLGHMDASTTKRVYRRRPERAKPVK